jgi:hypothetical protein
VNIGDVCNTHKEQLTDWCRLCALERLESKWRSTLPEDPRSILDDAARSRLACQILPRGGDWSAGHFVRVDKAGVVVVAPDLKLSGGEDVRVWFSMEDQPRSFEAAVLRAGVPVPDRSQDGLMLGFIDGWKSEALQQTQTDDTHLKVLPVNGQGLNLIGGDARLVEITTSEMAFAVPQSVALKFVEGGSVWVHYKEGAAEHSVSGTIRKLAPVEGHFLYALRFDAVENEKGHLETVESLQRFC